MTINELEKRIQLLERRVKLMDPNEKLNLDTFAVVNTRTNRAVHIALDFKAAAERASILANLCSQEYKVVRLNTVDDLFCAEYDMEDGQ